MSKQLLEKYGTGAKLLFKMGYISGTGLGKDGSGIIEPIMPRLRKRGEGIGGGNADDDSHDNSNNGFGNMMESRVVDDWDYSDSENDNADNNLPLGFEKSGLYRSEYDVPELIDTVREILTYDIVIPHDILEIIETGEYGDGGANLHIRKVFYDILKDIKLDSSKLKYLTFEIDNITKLNDECKLEIEIMNQVIKIVNEEEGKAILKVFDIEGIRNVGRNTKKDIAKLISSKILDNWTIQVSKCDITDLVEFCDLLDTASMYLKLRFITDSPMFIKIKNNEYNKPIKMIEFNEIESVILKPFINKIFEFFNNEFTLDNILLGLAIFGEIQDSSIFGQEIFEEIFINCLIIPKFQQIINQTEDNKWTVQWFKILPIKYVRQLSGEIIKKYSKLDEYNENTINELKYWLNVSPTEELKQCVDKNILTRLIHRLRSYVNLNIKSWDLINDECIEETNIFISNIKKYELNEYEDVVLYNELMIPYWVGYLQVDGDDEFLRQFVEIFSYLGLLNDENIISKSIKECYEFNKFLNKRNAGVKVLGNFKTIKDLLTERIDDIDLLLNKPKKKIIKNIEIEKTSIKDIVFQECEKAGIIIINNGYKDGKNIYLIDNKDKINVYFEGNIMYDLNGNGLCIMDII